uniref:polysaccharide pyruvyl transferase family protein n=1 Tax=Synechococcus sp. UW106 TaxID=368495 RepID=UPI001A7E1540|nr:polysaccharide pyruvyl transferase family protein [Synechococcus sp. UW106]
MFDMNNYGDLLFPLIAKYELGKRGFEVRALSPTGKTTDYKDALPSSGIWQFLDESRKCDGMLIGGGYIVHSHRMNFLKEYSEAGVGASVGPSTWLGATMIAASRDVPVAWNAPGVPHPIKKNLQELSIAAFRAADYLSFRDRASRKLAIEEENLQCNILPDPIINISSMWPQKDLKDIFDSFLKLHNISRNKRFIAVHLRKRSLRGQTIKSYANNLSKICKNLEVYPLLLGLGSAHNDNNIAKTLKYLLKEQEIDCQEIVPPTSLKLITASIANSEMYIGSSLHGYISAKSYEKPAIIVGFPSYNKFDGLTSQLKSKDELFDSWDKVWNNIGARIRNPKALPEDVKENINYHWDEITKAIISNPENKRKERLAFLSLVLKEGIEQKGTDWITTSFTTEKDRKAAAVFNENPQPF